MSEFKIKLDSKFKKQLRGVVEKYDFEVGVEDGEHYAGKKGEPGLKGQEIINIFARGPVRQMDKSKVNGKMSDIADKFMKHLGINFWLLPFQKSSSEINVFLKEFFKYAFGTSEKKRLINTLQAVVRNPILRGDYGHNSKLTQAIKGFDRLGIDTGQFFKSITVQVKRRFTP